MARSLVVAGAMVAYLAGSQAAPAQPAPGTVFRDCPECPELVVIPAGRFIMGSAAAEAAVNGVPADWAEVERPLHDVTIGSAFALGRYEVTFAEWDACVAGGGCAGHRPADLGWGRGRRPVINVSWQDAQAYVAWLSRRTGHSYRLPSESEWEYAARAGTTTARYWGESLDAGCAYANGPDLAALEEYPGWKLVMNCRDGYAQTAPVGSFRANGFGLYDMLGNVWELVADCWHDSYRDAPADGQVWSGGDCASRVMRGGSWNHFPPGLHAAFRWHYDPDLGYIIIGFRVARALP